MAYPEVPIPPTVPEFAYIAMAAKFGGRQYPHTSVGLIEAKTAMRTQHAKVRLQREPIEIRQMVVAKDPVIQTTADSARQAIFDGDYAQALQLATYLQGYGETDYKDSLGGEAFKLSLDVHRLFAGLLADRFGNIDLFLQEKWSGVFEDTKRWAAEQNFGREIDALRGVIHMVALNGTLGEDAKQSFDPSALVVIN